MTALELSIPKPFKSSAIWRQQSAASWRTREQTSCRSSTAHAPLSRYVAWMLAKCYTAWRTADSIKGDTRELDIAMLGHWDTWILPGICSKYDRLFKSYEFIWPYNCTKLCWIYCYDFFVLNLTLIVCYIPVCFQNRIDWVWNIIWSI